MLNLNSILVFSDKPKQLADFYKKIFQKDPDTDVNNFYGFLVGKSYISFMTHDKVKGENKQPERIIFNFETDDVKGEFERIKKLGVKVVAEPYQPEEAQDMWIATFADPDGNYFQLMSPWKGE